MNDQSTPPRKLTVTIFQIMACVVLALLFPFGTRAQNGSVLNHRLNQLGLPICLGVSGNNEVNYPASCGTGTLGSLLQDQNGVQYILSNAHVMAPVGGALGNPIQHVGSLDTIACGNALAIDNLTLLPPHNVVTRAPGNVANLSQCASPYAGDPCVASAVVDAAIAEVIPGQVSNSILDLPEGFFPAPQAPQMGAVVIKSGRTTARTAGKIIMVNVNVPPLNNQFLIAPYVQASISDGFALAGDSGSLVLEFLAGHPKLYPAGLLWGGLNMIINGYATNVTVASQIGDVLNTFQTNNKLTLTFVNPVRCTRQFPRGWQDGPAEAETTLTQGPQEEKDNLGIPVQEEASPDPGVVAQVSKIKDRYTDALMRLPNAYGAGGGAV